MPPHQQTRDRARAHSSYNRPQIAAAIFGCVLGALVIFCVCAALGSISWVIMTSLKKAGKGGARGGDFLAPNSFLAPLGANIRAVSARISGICTRCQPEQFAQGCMQGIVTFVCRAHAQASSLLRDMSLDLKDMLVLASSGCSPNDVI
jgi:hypothetical protein